MNWLARGFAMNGLRTHHVSFAVTDLASSKQSYGIVLGLAEIERFEMDIGGACYRAATPMCV